MRILQLTTHLETGGIGTYVVTLTRALRGRGHRVFVASGGGRLAAAVDAADAPHWLVDLRTKMECHPKVWLAARALAARIAQAPVDVIHAHTRVAQVAAALVSRRTGIPYVTTCHGFYRRRLSRRLWPCWGRLTVAISRPVEAHLLQDFRLLPSRVRLIPTGLDPARAARIITAEEQEAWRRRLEAAPGDRCVAVMTRLVPSKGVDDFLRALAQAARLVPDVRGVVIGDGADRPRLERLAQRLGLQRRVRFVGTVDDPAPLLRLCTAFVFPATGLEGLGLALLEAMAAGLPVVATKVGGVMDIVEHGYSGFLVPPGDVAALAERICQLVEDRALAARMGTAARGLVADRFSIERMAEAMETLYHDAVRRR